MVNEVLTGLHLRKADGDVSRRRNRPLRSTSRRRTVKCNVQRPFDIVCFINLGASAPDLKKVIGTLIVER